MSKKLSNYGLYLRYRTNKKVMRTLKKGSGSILTWSQSKQMLSDYSLEQKKRN